MSTTARKPVPSLNVLAQRIREVSTLPYVAMRILQITADPKTGASDLEGVLKSDPALSAKVLKLVNSPYFGLLQKTSSVKRACVMLGFTTIKDLAITASVCDLFKSNIYVGKYSRADLWVHCVGVAVTARLIADRANMKDLLENVFTAGILLDLGIILIDQFLNDHLPVIMTHPDIESTSLDLVERKVLGYDHGELAKMIVSVWGLPSELQSTTSFHHHPSKAPRDHQKLVSVMYLADTLCSFSKVGFATSAVAVASEFNFAMNVCGFNKDSLKAIKEEIPREILRAQDIVDTIKAIRKKEVN